MKIRTSFVAAVVATGAYLLATPAEAQFAVIDVAAVNQLVQQMNAWQQQLMSMRMQLLQLEQTRIALTGFRGMDKLLPLTSADRNYLPLDAAGLVALGLIAVAGLLDAPLKPYPRLVQWVHSHKEIAVAPDVLRRYAGVYESGEAAMRLTVEGNRLVAAEVREAGSIVAGDAFAPVGAGDFLLVTGPRRTIRLTFADDAQGHPAKLLQNTRGDLLKIGRAHV